MYQSTYLYVLSRLCVCGFYIQYIAKYKELKKKKISSRNQKMQRWLVGQQSSHLKGMTLLTDKVHKQELQCKWICFTQASLCIESSSKITCMAVMPLLLACMQGCLCETGIYAVVFVFALCLSVILCEICSDHVVHLKQNIEHLPTISKYQ